MSELREHVRDRYAAAAKAVEDGHAANDWDQKPDAVEPEHGLGTQLYDPTQRASCPMKPCSRASLRQSDVIAISREGESVLTWDRRRHRCPALGRTRGADGLGLGSNDREMLDSRERTREGVPRTSSSKGSSKTSRADVSVDVVISNCVINTVDGQTKVITEMFRVLRPVEVWASATWIAGDGLTAEERTTRGSYVGCIAGALSLSEYGDELMRAGFTDISVDLTHEMADEIYGANVRARKP